MNTTVKPLQNPVDLNQEESDDDAEGYIIDDPFNDRPTSVFLCLFKKVNQCFNILPVSTSPMTHTQTINVDIDIDIDPTLIPFNKYLFDKEGVFPSLIFFPPLLSSEYHGSLRFQCDMKLSKLFPPNHTDINAKQMPAYRGYYKGKSDSLFVFYDMENFVFDMEPYIWGIMDEITNKQHINETSIHREIVSFFCDHEELQNLPIQNNGENGENSYTASSYPIPYQFYLNQDKRTSHPLFGDFYYFSRESIPDTSQRRYAVFLNDDDNGLYILTDELQNIKPDILAQYRDRFLLSRMVYFVENGVKIWCVKSDLQFIEI